MNEAVSLVLFVYGLAIAIAMGAALLIKLIVGALALSERRAEAPAAAPKAVPLPAGADGIPPHHLVVIAAAAHAALGAHRILHIGAAASGRIWSTEGRMAQHTSHQPSHH
ncbi:MAG: hypothetical protein ACM31D_02690 [Bacteroidota bacterium]